MHPRRCAVRRLPSTRVRRASPSVRGGARTEVGEGLAARGLDVLGGVVGVPQFRGDPQLAPRHHTLSDGTLDTFAHLCEARARLE